MSVYKKKLLILVDWFTPGYKAGGPIQSNVNLAVALSDEYDVYVFTTDTDHGEKEPYIGIETEKWVYNEDLKISIFYAQKSKLGFGKVSKEINNLQPDFVYLNLLFSPYFNMYPLLLKYVGKIKGKVILCPRGSLYDSALSVSTLKKKPVLLLYKWLKIAKVISFHATNEREKEAINKYFPGANVIIADNLPNIQQTPFISLPKQPNELNCLFVARIVAIKNVLFILNVLKTVQSVIKFTIVGPIEDEVYWEECKKVIAELPHNISIDYVGPQKHSDIKKITLQNHLFVLPTTGENFGHAIFESFLAGRPVLISDQTPWLNLEEKNAGWDVPLNQPKIFAQHIEMLSNLNQQEYDTFAISAWKYAKNFIENNQAIKSYKLLFHE